MKRCYLLIFISLFGCKSNDVQEVLLDDFPWYISLHDSLLYQIDLKNELQDYSNLSKSSISENTKYLCYMADLNYVNNETSTARELLNSALKNDSIGVVQNYLQPIYKYLVRDRPDRRKSIPPIVDYDFDHFVELYHDNISTELDYYELFSNLATCKIRLYDQWYRVPRREFVMYKQDDLDSLTQVLMDDYFLDTDISQLEHSRSTFSAVILHSKDCDWSKKWILKYFESFKDRDFMKRQLTHYLWRSECRDVLEIKEMVENRIDQLQ